MTARITSGQRDRITEFAMAGTRKVVDTMALDIDQAQLVITNGDEFGQIVGDAVRLALTRLSVSQEYANEEVASTWVYPPEYTGPAPIGEQIETLARLYGISPNETMRFVEQVLPTLTLPDGAEGWFAIPSVNANFHNYREGQIAPDRLHQHARTAMMLERIAAEQQGDILVIPSQFGLRHAGRSVRRGRAVYAKTEFGHGTLAVGSMTLTHPTRFIRWGQLHTDCAGDDFTAVAVEFLRAPVFYFCDGRLWFGTARVGRAGESYGSASGFLPQ